MKRNTGKNNKNFPICSDPCPLRKITLSQWNFFRREKQRYLTFWHLWKVCFVFCVLPTSLSWNSNRSWYLWYAHKRLTLLIDNMAFIFSSWYSDIIKSFFFQTVFIFSFLIPLFHIYPLLFNNLKISYSFYVNYCDAIY